MRQKFSVIVDRCDRPFPLEKIEEMTDLMAGDGKLK